MSRVSLRSILALGVMLLMTAAPWAAYMERGNESYETGDFLQAIALYRKALQVGENPSLAYFNLGNCYYKTDSLSQAIVNYQSALIEAPDFFRAYLNLGILYFGLDDNAATVAVLERARPIEPHNAQLLMVLAAAYRNLHEYSCAIPLVEQALELDSTRDEGYFLLYEMVRGLGDRVGARSWLQRYPDSGTRVADKYLILAELEEELSGPRAATYYFTRAIEVAPQRRWGYYQLVKNLNRTGNRLLALRTADDALQRFPDFRELTLLAGSIAFTARYARRAEQYYRKACQQGGAEGVVGLQNLVHLYEEHGDTRSARRVNRFLVSMQ